MAGFTRLATDYCVTLAFLCLLNSEEEMLVTYSLLRNSQRLSIQWTPIRRTLTNAPLAYRRFSCDSSGRNCCLPLSCGYPHAVFDGNSINHLVLDDFVRDWIMGRKSLL